MATVERRDDGRAWRTLGSTTADGVGRLEWVDDDVRPGDAYAYRLAFGTGAERQLSGETFVTVPAVLALGLEGLRPNPTLGRLSVAFTLPDAAPASLEVLDVAGRLIARRDVGGLGSGRHLLDLARSTPAPGIYLVRLRRGAELRTARGIVVR
jgi:hypothetical protein